MESSNEHRIVFVATSVLSYDRRMQRITKSLAEAGFNCTLVGRTLDWKNLDMAGVRIHFLPVKRIKGPLFYAWFNLAAFLWLMRNQFDVICAVDYDSLLACSIAARIKKSSLVFDAHEWFEEVPELDGREGIKAIWRKIGNWGILPAKRCYTVSHSIANILSNQYQKSFAVVRNLPNYLNIVSDSPKVFSGDSIRLVYVGQLNEGRGIEEAIAVTRQCDWLQLHIYGTGDLKASLLKLAGKMTNGRVQFHGYLHPDNFQKLAQYDIGLNLLVAKSKSYYYSLGNKFFDYVQAGIPVIAMKYPEYENLNTTFDCSYLLEALDEESLMDKLVEIRSNPDIYRVKQIAVLQAKEQWHWTHEKELLIQIYKDL